MFTTTYVRYDSGRRIGERREKAVTRQRAYFLDN
jgi:hypothetical protein